MKFTKFDDTTNWVYGESDNGQIEFQAKLYDENSQFGINKGRVSKLWVGDNYGEIVHYDRGWDRKPRPGYETDVFEQVVDFLEKAPYRFK